MRALVITVLAILVLSLAVSTATKRNAVAREPVPYGPQQEMVVTSPIGGLFSISDMPGGSPTAKVGDHVTAGSVLGIVDNMPVRAMFSGTLAEIMAQDGQMVKPGQPLFRLKTP